MRIEPQEGYQMDSLSCPADVLIGGGAAGCFSYDTLVRTSEGLKQISKIEVGEYVLSFNTKSKKPEYKKVLKTFSYERAAVQNKMVRFDYLGQTIKCTDNHKFYFNGVFETIDKLKSIVVNNSQTFGWYFAKAREINPSKISKYKEILMHDYVYDLCVEDNHNYCITEKNIIVHNSGKTFGILLEAVRHIDKKGMEAVMFRRTKEQIKNAGGLLDASKKLYASIPDFKLNHTSLQWKKENGAKITLRHLDPNSYENDWQGSEITLIIFDELTHFKEKEFFYMLSRNRSTCGVNPYVRATCNPDPDSWVARFIDWWIGDDGLPIPEREGKIRYFYKHGETMFWGDSKEDVYSQCRHHLDEVIDRTGHDYTNFIKSLSFISGSIYDNKKLLDENPEYLANLHSQSDEMRKRLLDGNWKHALTDVDVISPIKFEDVFSNDFVRKGKRRITADIAFEGADIFVIFVWEGKRLIDWEAYDKSEPDKVEREILDKARRWRVSQSNICYDADGLGGYLKGYMKNAYPFHNGRRAIKEPGGQNKYRNLKAQCFYNLGNAIDNDEYYIPIELQLKTFNGKTLRTHLTEERRAIKKKERKDYEPHALISKNDMKAIIGHSPDFFDTFAMNEIFDLIV